MIQLIHLKKYCIFLSIIIISSCSKFLEEKPNKSLVIPSKVRDLQALLDNNSIMNSYAATSGEAASDNYYVTDVIYNALSKNTEKQAYIWQDDIFTDYPNDWARIYDVVNASNIVLDEIDNIEDITATNFDRNFAKGAALFFRAKSFLEAIQIWGKAYNKATAGDDLGIPLRLHSDFNQVSSRSSVKATYEQILSDLHAAAGLLTERMEHVIRPSKIAAYGMLARTYLLMNNYEMAGKYTDSTLQYYSGLIDFNTLNANDANPIKQFNNEVVFQNINSSIPSILSRTRAIVDSNLIKQYEGNDLRRAVFFLKNSDGSYSFKGNYSGSSAFFNGIATDEMYLIAAECFVRQGNLELGAQSLNNLLVKRYKAGTFNDFHFQDAKAALQIVLNERRKELLFRLLRWGDIKRLNANGENIVLTRMLSGKTYTLPPNDLRYALPLPSDIIQLSGMQQNPR